MAKRERDPDQPMPPFTELAATGPGTMIPKPTPAAPRSIEKPVMKSIGGAYDPTEPQKTRPDQLDEMLVLYPPAVAKLSVFGSSLVGECAIANGLGTQEPAKVLVGHSDDRTQWFLMPVGSTASKGVEVTFNDGRATINLRKALQGKVVEEGYREYYHLWRTDTPITIMETTGWAVFFSLEQREREKSETRDPATEAAKPKAKKVEGAKATAKEAPAEATTAPTDATVDPESESVYNEIIAEQEIKLLELEAHLKAYQEKYGKL